MIRRGVSGGNRLALTAQLDEGSPAVVVRVYLDNPLVACAEAAFPVKTMEAARRFVATADQDAFDRAMEQMAPHLQQATLFISSMNSAIEAKKERKHEFPTHQRVRSWQHSADRRR